jgi:hypothetical protein
MAKTYLPSSTPGKVWSIYTYKPEGRPAYASACEGVLGDGFFTTEIHLGTPSHPATRVSIQAPATAKRKAAALEQLKIQLVEAGLAASTVPVA